MSFRDKIVQKMQADDSSDFALEQQEKELPVEELEVFTPSPFYRVENARNVPASLEFRLTNGNASAFPYTYLMEINYKPSEIEMLYTTKKVLITGRNLKQLYLFLVAFRVRFIEANVGNDLTEENKLFVKGISIQEI